MFFCFGAAAGDTQELFLASSGCPSGTLKIEPRLATHARQGALP